MGDDAKSSWGYSLAAKLKPTTLRKSQVLQLRAQPKYKDYAQPISTPLYLEEDGDQLLSVMASYNFELSLKVR